MARYIYILILFLSTSSFSSAQTIMAADSIVNMEDLLNDNLPLILINTIDGEEPAFDPIDTPEGCLGTGITNATKVPGRMYIILGNDTLYDSGDYHDDISGMTIKIRGNSSAYSLKKSYKIKLQKKADLLCRGNDDVYKDKDWVLLRDETNLTNNMTGFTVAKLMNFSWIPSFEYANMVINGSYRGIYLLAESVKRNSKCRINVDEDTGYIIENDAYWWNEDLYFDSSFDLNYTFKYPDSEDVTDDQLEYIQNAVNIMETSLDDGTYTEYIDVSSFANWCLTHDLLGTYDEAGSNMFLSKYDNSENSKFKMETPWDFDTIELYSDEWANVHNSIGFVFCKLFNNQNVEFERQYVAIWKEKRDSIISKIIEQLDSFEHSDLAIALDFYCPLDKKVNLLEYESIPNQIEESKQWFSERMDWLDEAICELENEIGLWMLPFLNPTEKIYDTQGQQITRSSQGIVIQNGKKYIIK